MIPMRIFVYHFYLILIFLKFVLCLLISGKVVDIISKSFLLNLKQNKTTLTWE